MGKIIRIILIIIYIIGAWASLRAQTNEQIRAGLLRVQGTISPSYMLATRENYFYLHGSLEGYLSKRLSCVGDVFVSMGALTDSVTFRFNHNIFFGAAWHWAHRQHDLYAGLQAGAAYSRLNPTDSLPTHAGINPVLSPVLGYQFYAHRFFHFFVQTRFVIGSHLYDAARPLQELRLSAGLGFNLNTIR